MPQITIDRAMQLALEHHQAGRLQQAEQIYQKILAQAPEHAPALHYLGLIAHQSGRNDIAVDLIRRAIAFQPHDVEAYSNLGTILKDSGQLDESVAVYRRAIALRPELAGVHYNLGIVLGKKGLFEEAILAYHQAIALNPSYAEAYGNLGNALKDAGKIDDAIDAYRRAIALKPALSEAHFSLGVTLETRGRFVEAIVAYRRAIAANPMMVEAHCNLGNALREEGQLDDAIVACRNAIALRPGYAEAHSNLGLALREKEQFDEAIAAYQQAIALRFDLPEVHFNLGIALAEKGQLDEAIAAYRQAIALRPNYPQAHNNVGVALVCSGQLDEAIESARRAIALLPTYAEAHSNLVFTLHFHPGYDASAIAQEHRRWNERHAKPLGKFLKPHGNDPNPARRLRIGYVSPDFRDHVVGRNVLPLFREHDRDRFEVFCYSNVLRPDELTTQFQACCDNWRNIVGLSDEQVAALVREDRIDILIDLTLHMERNRLLVFARKPAPVQVTFGGYPGTTGLDAIDYRLTDPYLDPFDSAQGEGGSGPSDAFYSEQSIRLPESFWCYDPAVMTGAGIEPQPPVGPLPAFSAGQLTFGCLNNFCKVNEQVLALWARVLKEVPGSRLMLMAPQGSARQRTLEILGREGIDPARIEFVAGVARGDYLQRYGWIDIGLDTFPYNGHTTSLDALWMGVPVVTRVGQTVVGRAGLSQLTNLKLTELVATDEDQYVRIAAELAGDLPRLAELRAGLRQRMRESPLTDAPRFARNVECAYRDMWRQWCEQNGQAVKDD